MVTPHLKDREGQVSQDTAASKGHSPTVKCRGREKSGYQKLLSKQGSKGHSHSVEHKGRTNKNIKKKLSEPGTLTSFVIQREE
jgi:hypothetical protein